MLFERKAPVIEPKEEGHRVPRLVEGSAPFFVQSSWWASLSGGEHVDSRAQVKAASCLHPFRLCLVHETSAFIPESREVLAKDEAGESHVQASFKSLRPPTLAALPPLPAAIAFRRRRDDAEAHAKRHFGCKTSHVLVGVHSWYWV